MKNTDRVFIIAEAGVNHNGSIRIAREMIEVAAQAGSDAVKFQTFQTEKGLCLSAPKADYQIRNTGTSESQLEMIKKLELSQEDHYILRDHCKLHGIEFMSTPFDFESVDLLVKLNVGRLKIGSGEIVNAPLLLKAAWTGKPIILSTGMSSLGEIETALGVLAFGYSFEAGIPSLSNFKKAFSTIEGQKALQEKVSLLHCTTEYPAAFSEVNLRAMDTLKTAFGLKVGYSDHTSGIAVPIAAAARGAVIIEKHFTLDRNFEGPDHKASIEPEELTAMVRSIREVEASLGSTCKMPSPSESKNLDIARKSLVASKMIGRGEEFTADNIGIKRPGNGLSPMFYWNLIGTKAEKDYDIDQMVGPIIDNYKYWKEL